MSALQKKGFTLIELLVVIGILAILLTIVLIAINPARQFAQANDTKRRNDVLAILNSIHQYSAEHKGVLPAGIPVTSTVAPIVTPAPIAKGAAGDADLCGVLSPLYISSFPNDPTNSFNAGAPITDCTVAAYTTGYTVGQDASGRVTVAGVAQVSGGDPITVTR